jgi:ribosomal protein L28
MRCHVVWWIVKDVSNWFTTSVFRAAVSNTILNTKKTFFPNLVSAGNRNPTTQPLESWYTVWACSACLKVMHAAEDWPLSWRVMCWSLTPYSLIQIYRPFEESCWFSWSRTVIERRKYQETRNLKMEAVCSFETFVHLYENIRRHISEDHYFRNQRCENLKSNKHFLIKIHCLTFGDAHCIY